MKAVDYLKRIKILDSQIDNDIEELSTLEALATKTTSVMGGERIQASGSQEKMADCIAKIVDLQKEINEEIDRFTDFRKEARKLIHEACDADCMRLLHLRYLGVYNETTEKIEFRTWEQIAVEMNFTYQWVSGGLHQRALSQLQKALDERGAE